jgi:RHS repeat-associated protein
VADGRNTYAYSDRGRMASAVTAAGTVAYVYNGLGQRAKKSGPAALVPTGASYFVYDEGGQLLGEYDADGYPLYETVYLGSTPVGVVKHTGRAATNDLAAVVYNVYPDHIDTPRMITTQGHAIVWRWDTAEPFGATQPEDNPNGAGKFVYNQRFPGQVFDAETGLFQNWNREYEPRTGRYVQSDPIGLAGGINTFAYVLGSPVMDSDPTGLANSGQMKKVPGTNFTVRIDPPHVPGQQSHAHVYDNKGNLITAVSKDGSPSHGMCPDVEMPKNKKLLDFLRVAGFKLSFVGDVLFLRDLVNNVGRVSDPSNPLFRSDDDTPF